MNRATPTPTPPIAGRIIGYVDSVSEGVVTGWAAEDPPGDPVDVELLIDGVGVGQAIADLLRDDLVKAGVGTGRHGFTLAVPKAFLDGQPHVVGVRVGGFGHVIYPAIADCVLGAPPPPRPAARLPAPRIGHPIELSLIMPTYGRGALMEATVERYLRSAERAGAELIVIDDGSRDDTPDRLRRLAAGSSRLVTERVANGGPARARNLAASMARGRILVFVGDDVVPVDDDFLAIHAAAHTRMPKVGHAILGKISWPNADQLAVNFVMSHIQGEGEQQFGYHAMTAYRWYDWRLFYSSNVSVKKALVPDWMAGGYDASFQLAAFEDPEFALRMTLRMQENADTFGIFYVPAAHLVHHHPYTVSSFLSRQVSAGMMAQRFLELHPSRAADLGLAELRDRLTLPMRGTSFPIEHYFSVFEGLKSWTLVIEHHYGLGNQNWHADLLKAIFQLAFFEGYLRVQSGPDVNLAAGCRYVLEVMRTKMNRGIATEILGDVPGFGLV